jgi:hypothetical protein
MFYAVVGVVLSIFLVGSFLPQVDLRQVIGAPSGRLNLIRDPKQKARPR